MTQEVKDRLLIEIKKACAAYKRYSITSIFAILYHDKPLSITELSQYIRASDGIYTIDEHHYFINYAYSKEQGAFKACQNLIHNLDKHFNDQSSYMAMSSFDETQTPTIVLNRLNQILAEMKKHPESRIEDENILGSMV